MRCVRYCSMTKPEIKKALDVLREAALENKPKPSLTNWGEMTEQEMKIALDKLRKCAIMLSERRS